jgi:hypothetical protein
MNMPEQELIPLSSKEIWQSRLNEIPHHFGHTWEHCQAMFLSSGYPTYLYSFRMDNVLVLCPVCERSFEGYIDMVTPYGFNGFISKGDYPDFNSHWKAFVKERGYICGYIGLNPLVNIDLGFSPVEIREYNEIFTLDLTQTRETLIEGLDVNRRRQLKKMDLLLRSSLTMDKQRLSTFFKRNYDAFMKGKSATGAYHFSESSLQWMADMENIMMTGLLENGQVVAVSLFGYTPYAADFLFNISTGKGKEGSFALMWMAIEKLSSMNIPVLNLGGGVKSGDSLSMFKKRFGGNLKPLRSLQQVFDGPVFQQLCEMNGVNISGTSYFPPYRAGL